MAIEKLLEEALALSPKERSELAHALIRSLEPEGEELGEEEWSAAWTKEIERRVKDLDEGRAKTITYEELKAEMNALLSRG